VDKSKTIIIKKIKKGGGGHHGGAWKVAYADFVTAMMAFFLLMWLVTMTPEEKKVGISSYFKQFSIFQDPGQALLSGQTEILEKRGADEKSTALEIGKKTGEIHAEDVKSNMEKAITGKLSGIQNQVIVDVFEGGVRIQIVDFEGKPMFLPGSAQLTPIAKELLHIVAENIKELPHRVAVEGHTDSSGVKKGQMSNWELSTERALSARRTLEANGITHDRIARVVGYADSELLFKDNPTDPRNRRMSIILLQPKPAEPPKAELQPLPPPPKHEEPAETKKPAEAPAPRKEGAGPDLGIKPKEPVIKPMDLPGGRQPEQQLRAAPQPKPAETKPAISLPPLPPPKPEPEAKKGPAEKAKPAPKQEQKKDTKRPDMGISPITPITPVVPGR
jgi:chemotaxis protein MotB